MPRENIILDDDSHRFCARNFPTLNMISSWCQQNSLKIPICKEKLSKKIAKDQLHYVKEGQVGVGIGYTEQKVVENFFNVN